jgi:hypothetical protein
MAQLAFKELTLPVNPRPFGALPKLTQKEKSLTRKSP